MKLLIQTAVVLLALAATAGADVVVPNAYAATAGPSYQLGILGNGNLTENTFQVGYAASQLGGIAVGDQITSIAVRLAAGEGTITTPLNYTGYSIQIGRAANAVGSFSSTFAANQGADTITARAGAMTIAANSLVGGSGPNPFYTINFTTPYTYTGGPLAITLRWTSVLANRVAVDALDLNLAPSVVDTVSSPGNATAATGTAQFFVAPILRLGVRAVPEPSSIALVGIGLAASVGLGLARRRRTA
ncbi:MAG: PEP-CTERM sorting domain-containing protein [Isosphaeraceae bacterium]